jgi:hypothetical protein
VGSCGRRDGEDDVELRWLPDLLLEVLAQVAVRDAAADQMHLLGAASLGRDLESSLGEVVASVNVEEAGHSVDSNAKACLDGDLGSGDDGPSSGAEVEHTLSWLQVGHLDGLAGVGRQRGREVLVLAHHGLEGLADVGGLAVVDHDGGEVDGKPRVSMLARMHHGVWVHRTKRAVESNWEWLGRRQ